MRPPGFWRRPPANPGWQARALAPLGAAYAAATAARIARPPDFSPDIPVLCVGNLEAGGAGKTPAAIALAQRLQARGATPAMVSRGHGGSLKGPVEVDPKIHAHAEVGDEPLLLGAFARTWIGRDRAAAARLAAASGADAIVMDDGFQNPSVRKDLSLVVADAANGFGNGRCMPAGPLREPPQAGLARADLVLAVGTQAAQRGFAESWGGMVRVPLLAGRLEPLETGMAWRGMRALAFAGIGRPEKFFATLQALGAEVVRACPLDDHQRLSRALMARLDAEAAALDAQLVTTEKDAVRLPAEFRQKVVTLPVRLVLDDWSSIDAAISRLGL